jgi:hypothetical protein
MVKWRVLVDAVVEMTVEATFKDEAEAKAIQRARKVRYAAQLGEIRLLIKDDAAHAEYE